MIGFLRETAQLARHAAGPWRRLDHWLRALIAAVPAWGLAMAVMFGSIPFFSFSGGEASAALPPNVDPPVPGAMATMRYEDGNVVLYARGVDGSWEEVKPVDQAVTPGQFAKFATTSPDRRLVSYVKADDQLMNNAHITVVDIETGQERDLATIPTGFFPATPVWSPDASRLAFAKKEGDFIELWVVHVATGELLQVPSEEPISPQAFYGSNPNPLVWSEDGESLSFDVPDLTGRRMVHFNVNIGSGKLNKKRGEDLPERQPCEVPVFSQNDPTWANNVMQELGDTIGAAGCALTSTAMVLNYFGNNRDPGALNSCLGPAAEPVYWAVAAQRNCNAGSGEFEDYVAFSWDKLASLMAEGRPVVLGFAGGITGSHYVVVNSGFGSDGANYSIIDPWDGTTWKTIDYYAEKGYSPEWLVIYRGQEGECTARTTAPPVKAPDLSFGVAATGLEATWQWRPLIEQVAGETGVDPDIIQAVMAFESGGNPNEVGPYTGSLGEAMGLMQVMNGLDGPWNFVAQYIGHYPSHDEMLVPLNNIRAGAYELKWRHDLGGNWSDWLITAVGYFGATTPDGQITGARDAFGTDGWMYYDRIRANYIAIRQRLGSGGAELPNPPTDVRRPAEWPPAGTIEMLLGGADYTISQGFGYTGFTPSPGAYDYASAYGLQAGDHAAIDIAIPYGTALYSPISTSVLYASSDIYYAPNHVDLAIPGMGGCAEIIFGHMSDVRVSVGQTVQPATFLGFSGTAGTGPHVHLEVRVPDASTSSGCRAVDPRIFFGMGGDFAQLPRPDVGPAPPPPPGPGQPTATQPAAPPAPGAPTNTPKPTSTPKPTATTGSGAQPTNTVTATQSDAAKMGPTATPGDSKTGLVIEPTTTAPINISPGPGTVTAAQGGSELTNAQGQIPQPGQPGSGKLPGTPTPIPTSDPIQAQDLPVVTVIGPADWKSYDKPVTFDRIIVDFPADPNAVVSVNTPVGTTFTKEGKYTIQVTVISPKIPGGILTHTVSFFIDNSAPVINAEVTGKQFLPQPDDAGQKMGSLESNSAAVRTLAAPSTQGGQTTSPSSCYDGEATISFTYDDSGTPIKAVAYSIDDGRWHYYTNNAIPHAISLLRHGSHTLDFYAIDAAGNQSTSQVLSVCVVANPAVPIGAPEPTPTVTPSPTPEERIGEEREADLRILEPDQLAASPTVLLPTSTPSPTSTPEGSPALASPTAQAPTTTPNPTTTPTNTPEPTATNTPPPVIVEPPTSTPTEPVVQPPTRTPTVTPEPTEPNEGGREFAPTATITPSPEPSTGDVQIEKVDSEDQPLAGACFALVAAESAEPTPTAGPASEDATEICDESDGANDGTIVFAALAAGSYDLIETLPPPGFAPIAPIRITAEAGQSLTYKVENSARLGAIQVAWEGGTASPSPDACFELYTFGGVGGPGGRVRDQQCITESVETITFADLVPGNYVVSQSRTPSQHQAASPLFVPVLSGTTTEVTIQNTLLPASLSIEKRDAATDGLVAGACFDVYAIVNGERGTRLVGACDDADGSADGVTGIAGIPPGTHLVAETQAPPNYAAAPDTEITLAPGDARTIVIENTLIQGSVTILKTNAQTDQAVPGACFVVYTATDSDQIDPVDTVCDSGDGQDDGTTSIANLTPDDYVLMESVTPPGFSPAADMPFTVAAGQPTNLVVPNHPIFGGIRITKTGEGSSTPLPGACFDIYQDDGAGGPGAFAAAICDNADGQDDGISDVSNLAPGGYVVVETTVPAGYLPAPNTTAAVSANVITELSIVDPIQHATLTVRKVDGAGTLLNGACFDLYTSAGGSPDQYVAGGCDGEQIQTANGDVYPDPLDGTMTFGELAAGIYVVDETVPPAGGYAASGNVEVAVDPGQDQAIDVVNTFNPTGDVQVTTYGDSAGTRVPLPGVCIAIYEMSTFGSGDPPLAQQCDDDANAALLFTALPVNHYYAFVSDVPAGYQSGDSVPFEITSGAQTSVEIDVPLIPHHSVTIRTMDSYSSLLVPGACYEVQLSGSTIAESCDDADGANDGQVPFSLPTGGPYDLQPTTTPAGYFEPAVTEFSVSDSFALDVMIDPLETPTPPPDPVPEGSIRIFNYGPDDVPLPEACFYIVDVTASGMGDNFAQTFCDSATAPHSPDGNPDGILIVGPLTPGDYRVNQTSPPPGYAFPMSNVYWITVTAGSTQDLVFHNEPLASTGSITVTLTKEGTSEPLEARQFQLFHSDTETIVQAATTNASGIAIFTGITPDTDRPDAYCVWPVEVSGWYYTPEELCMPIAAGDELSVEFTSGEQTMWRPPPNNTFTYLGWTGFTPFAYLPPPASPLTLPR